MLWSDRLWHWLVSLGGLGIVALGIIGMYVIHWGRMGGVVVGIGFGIFVFGFPTQAQRNGYRE